MEQLVACPQPLRHLLAQEHLFAATESPGALLAVLTRRYYKIRDLRSVRIERIGSEEICRAEYVHDGRTVHIVAVRVLEDRLADAIDAAAEVAGTVADPDTVTVDLYLSSPAATVDTSTMAERVRQICSGPRRCRSRSGGWP